MTNDWCYSEVSWGQRWKDTEGEGEKEGEGEGEGEGEEEGDVIFSDRWMKFTPRYWKYEEKEVNGTCAGMIQVSIDCVVMIGVGSMVKSDE